jgi:hypothetical protein
MRGRIAAAGVFIMLLSHPSAAAEDICGAAMERLDAATADAVQHAVFDLAVSSAAGETFAFHAQRVYGVLIKRREDHARLLAVALLRAYCVFLTRNEDPARFSWHVKSQLEGMARLVPDFREAQALLDRITAAEQQRRP